MKNKSLIMKILIIGSILLFILLFIVIFALIKLFIPKVENMDTKRIISQSYEIDNIEEISFDFRKANSVFVIDEDNDELLIVQEYKEEQFYLDYKKSKNKISFVENSYLMNPQKKKYTIYIPKKYMNKINIINGFGEIEVSNIINDLNLNNNSGKITLDTIGNIYIKDVSGDISIKNIIGNIEGVTSTGDVTIKDIEGSINMETITGDITLVGSNLKEESKFESISGDIILDISNTTNCIINYSNETGKTKIDENICIEGEIPINVKNVTGMIKIY